MITTDEKIRVLQNQISRLNTILDSIPELYGDKSVPGYVMELAICEHVLRDLEHERDKNLSVMD